MKYSFLLSCILVYCTMSVSVPVIERIKLRSMNDIKKFINSRTLFIFDIDNTMLYDTEEPLGGLVEPTLFPQIFSAITKKSWGILAITARTVAQSYQHFTLGQLNSFGLHFTDFFPDNTRDTISCILLNDGNKAYYNDGVIFVSGTNKGQALKVFLSHLPVLPSTIIFVDDKRYNINNVALAFEKEELFDTVKKIILCDYPYVNDHRF